MKISAFNFISQYLSDNQIDEIRQYYIKDNGKSPFQPIEWTQENKAVPKTIRKSEDVDYTIWILIRYKGAFDRLVISDDYEHDLRDEYQRAIAIDYKDDSITWKMFKNGKKIHTREKYMRTFGVVK